jgi:ribosomal protein S18 acetylase RimI-like enzyme
VSELEAVQGAVRADAVKRRDVVAAGPFTCTFSTSANPFLNYAIPAAGAVPRGADVAALVDAFRRRGRKPRLEYVASLAPAVWPALEAAGFDVELRTPLMVFRGGERVAAPPGIELVDVETLDDVREATDVQFEAYEEAEPATESWVQGVAASLRDGGILALARDGATAAGAGAGACTAPNGGACELTSVGVRVRFRRRGIACALTSHLAHRATARGVRTVFLMAQGDRESRIYERAGFERIDEVVHVSKAVE